MKWLLIVMVMNQPFKTDLVFPSLTECLAAEHQMRKEWRAMYKEATLRPEFLKLSKDEQKSSKDFMEKQSTWGTCIPAK